MQPVITATPLAPEFLRIKPAASFIGMSASFLRKEARNSRGPERVRCGKVLLYPISGLRAAHGLRRAPGSNTGRAPLARTPWLLTNALPAPGSPRTLRKMARCFNNVCCRLQTEQCKQRYLGMSICCCNNDRY
jgi:hypothetical protein